ncbi:MAG: redoxin family protein [Bdellovibrionaceae bacterium]|nr:redoxin family protein [Pseudobdellovibrionaceae bacterium]
MVFFRCVVFLIFFCSSAFAGAETLDLGGLYGQTLPELEAFSLKDLQKSKEFKPKGYVVTFMSAYCPCSNSHVEELKELASTYKDFQFVFVHSNTNEPHETAVKYFKSKNIPFPVISDPKARIADEFKALKTPHTFLLNAKGEVLYKGGVSDSSHFSHAKKKFLREALGQVAKGQTPKVKYGRTLGCQIIRL